jgi:hypothetical protein
VCADLGDTIRETCANEMRWLASVEQSLYKAEDEIGRLERELAAKTAECARLRSVAPTSAEVERVAQQLEFRQIGEDIGNAAIPPELYEACSKAGRVYTEAAALLRSLDKRVQEAERECAEFRAECERLRSVAPDSAEVEAIAVYLEGLENYKDAALLRSLDMAHKLALGLGNLQRERAESAEAKLYKSQMDRTNLEADCEAQRAKLRRVAEFIFKYRENAALNWDAIERIAEVVK